MATQSDFPKYFRLGACLLVSWTAFVYSLGLMVGVTVSLGPRYLPSMVIAFLVSIPVAVIVLKLIRRSRTWRDQLKENYPRIFSGIVGIILLVLLLVLLGGLLASEKIVPDLRSRDAEAARQSFNVVSEIAVQPAKSERTLAEF